MMSPGPDRVISSLGPYSEFSTRHRHRVLLDYFLGVLSHLIVLGGEGSNPFQQLVVPMALGSQTVQNALYALTSAHLDRNQGGSWAGQESAHFHQKVIQGLSRMLEAKPTGRARNELLASIMLLVYYEAVSCDLVEINDGIFPTTC